MSWPSLEDVLSCLVGSHKADCFDIRMITNKVHSFKRKINDHHKGTNGYRFLNITNFPFPHCYEGEIFILLCFNAGFPFWSSLLLCPLNSLNYKVYLAFSLSLFFSFAIPEFPLLTLKPTTPIFLENNSPSEHLRSCFLALSSVWAQTHF